jgi:hypothetical protein
VDLTALGFSPRLHLLDVASALFDTASQEEKPHQRVYLSLCPIDSEIISHLRQLTVGRSPESVEKTDLEKIMNSEL